MPVAQETTVQAMEAEQSAENALSLLRSTSLAREARQGAALTGRAMQCIRPVPTRTAHAWVT